LDAVRVTETEDGDAKGWKISDFSVLHAVFFEEGRGFVKFSAVGDAKAEVIQPYAVRAKTIVGESLACVPGRRNT